MGNKFKMLALGAVFAVGASGAAMAQVCPAGYGWNRRGMRPDGHGSGLRLCAGQPGFRRRGGRSRGRRKAPRRPVRSARLSAGRSARLAARLPERRTW